VPKSRLLVAALAAAACVVACSRDWSFLASTPDHDSGADGATADASPDAPSIDAGPGDATALDAADAAPTDSTVTDAPVDSGFDVAVSDAGPLCAIDAAFTSLTLVAGGVNSLADEWQATLLPDERTIYFGRGTWGGPFDIYIATRDGLDAGFGDASIVANVSTLDAAQVGATITSDGGTLYVDDYASGARHVMVATATDGGFGVATLVTELQSTGEDGTPFVLPSGDVIYFMSFAKWRGDGDGGFDVYRSEKSLGGDFQKPAPVPVINGGNLVFDGYPVVTSDELNVYFGSGRGKGGYETDVYVATRASTSQDFGTPTLVKELATSAQNNFPVWLSPDRCRLYFASDRSSSAPTTGTVDLWLAERSP
jgi:hypothetical protein